MAFAAPSFIKMDSNAHVICLISEYGQDETTDCLAPVSSLICSLYRQIIFPLFSNHFLPKKYRTPTVPQNPIFLPYILFRIQQVFQKIGGSCWPCRLTYNKSPEGSYGKCLVCEAPTLGSSLRKTSSFEDEATGSHGGHFCLCCVPGSALLANVQFRFIYIYKLR